MARIWELWLLVFSVLVLVSNVQADDEDEPCTVRDGDQFFDLNPLKSKTDYTLKSVDGHDIYINVCQPATKETWALTVKEPDKVGGFTRREHGDFSLGYANTTLAVRDGSPTLTMVKGSPCPTHQHMHAATTIHFKCDTSAGIGEPVLIAQLPPPEDSSCYFFIEWKTNVACPTHMRRGSGGAWSVLNILASTIGGLFVLYVVLGTLYNFLVLDLRGLDAIPRYSLVSLQDTIHFFRKWYARFANRGSSGGYLGNRRTNISSHYRGLADEEEGMLSGPPGFLDEQDDEDEEEHPPANGPAHGMDTNGVIRL